MVAPHRPQDLTRDPLPLGRVLITPDALDALTAAGADGRELLDRHRRGDWGDLDAHDRAANEAAVVEGERVLSAYTLRTGATVWILTEYDRAHTTILVPANY
ncbi:hypothetical protein tb265_49320 [Gemmatimonadetes bacterium T265]|nr:hypothetical protein tb265_49320 [Gemmatimonadetes bacterium T265]